ncbi:MAG: hypothetical protein WC393_04045 [Candidatus Nanoarchaeia archaeon]|jgi:hypothetical protein
MAEQATQIPTNPKQAQDKLFNDLETIKNNSNLASVKYKSIHIVFFLVQLLLFIGLIVLSFKLIETLTDKSQLVWVIILIIISILGTGTIISLQIYIIYKKILNGVIKNFWLQLIVSVITGQIIAFATSTVFIDKLGVKMSFVQTITFFIFLLAWLGVGVGFFLSSGIILDDLIANVMNSMTNMKSLFDFNTLGQTTEEISGGQVNASLVDSISSMVDEFIDVISSVFSNLNKVQGIGVQ